MFFGWLLWPLWFSLVLAFPEYQDPFTLDPPLVRPTTKACVVSLFKNERLSYSNIPRTYYTGAPTQCLGSESWSRVILDWNGHVAGLQFDRVGALWFAGFELLRTTTPEPDPEGIRWHVERDVTEYSWLFGPNFQFPNATACVLNIVNSKYTGVITINATLTFYAPIKGEPPLDIPYLALFGNDPTSWANPFDMLTTYTSRSALIEVVFDARNFNRIYMDLYASGHGDDEFWYTNLPDQYAKKLGVPGGGSYRELIVYIDGTFAGSVYPFPVIYTGGVNPFLWRPLTGISSFDIPPYRIDLSPFASTFNDGHFHNLTVEVYSDNEKGFWYLDPVLVMYRDHDAVLVDGESKVVDGKPKVNVIVVPTGSNSSESGKGKPGLSFYTYGSHAYTISGVVRSHYANRTSKEVSVVLEGKLVSTNFNFLTLDGNTGGTDGTLSTSITKTIANPTISNIEVSDFYSPYSVYLEEYNNTLTGRVQYSRERKEARINPGKQEMFQISWKNEITSRAFYYMDAFDKDLVGGLTSHSQRRHQRPLGHYYAVSDSDAVNFSTETYSVISPVAGWCYDETVSARQGEVVAREGDMSNYNCSFPGSIHMCGSELCHFEFK